MEMKRWIGLVVLATRIHGRQRLRPGSYEGAAWASHNIEAPLGVRWWLSSGKFAIDAGLGFGSTEDAATDEGLSHWATRHRRADLPSSGGIASTSCSGPGFSTSQEEITGVAPITTDDTTVLCGPGRARSGGLPRRQRELSRRPRVRDLQHRLRGWRKHERLGHHRCELHEHRVPRLSLRRVGHG